MDKYFAIKETDGRNQYICEYKTKEEMLEDIEEFCKHEVNTVRIIKGKELKLIKKEIILKYDVED